MIPLLRYLNPHLHVVSTFFPSSLHPPPSLCPSPRSLPLTLPSSPPPDLSYFPLYSLSRFRLSIPLLSIRARANSYVCRTSQKATRWRRSVCPFSERIFYFRVTTHRAPLGLRCCSRTALISWQRPPPRPALAWMALATLR